MADNPTLNAFGIVVDDMARSLAFYRALGLDLPDDTDGQPHVEAALGGGVRLMFDTVEIVRSFDPDWEPPAGGHRIALAFECAGPDAVNAAHDRLVGLGYRSHKAPWDAVWGQRYAVLLDPDGNKVDLYAALPDAS